MEEMLADPFAQGFFGGGMGGMYDSLADPTGMTNAGEQDPYAAQAEWLLADDDGDGVPNASDADPNDPAIQTQQQLIDAGTAAQAGMMADQESFYDRQMADSREMLDRQEQLSETERKAYTALAVGGVAGGVAAPIVGAAIAKRMGRDAKAPKAPGAKAPGAKAPGAKAPGRSLAVQPRNVGSSRAARDAKVVKVRNLAKTTPKLNPKLATAGKIAGRTARVAGVAGLAAGALVSAAEEAREWEKTKKRYGAAGGALVASSDVVVKTATLGMADTRKVASAVRKAPKVAKRTKSIAKQVYRGRPKSVKQAKRNVKRNVRKLKKKLKFW